MDYGINGQCDDTGPLLLNADNSPQYFTSPNYPSNYPANADCSWRILAPSTDDRIIINIEDYDSESTTSDYMDLYDGYNTSATRIIRMAVTNRKTLNAFVSSSDALYITFVSDYWIQYTGFQILYFTNNAANQAGCDDTLTVTGSEQILMSPNLPAAYDASHSCSWTFSSTTGILFQIKFLDMGNCGTSHLRFYDGNSTADTQLDTVCSTALVYEFTDIETTEFTGHIVWTVTTPTSDFYGFMLIYRTNVVTTTSTTSTTTTMIPSVLDNCTASGAYLSPAISPNSVFINSPQYGSAYPSNTLCIWYISAPEDYAVEANFDDETFAIETHTYCSYDYVIIYDGNTTSDSILSKFCGSVSPSSIYRSSGQQMMIIFSSDYSLQYAGFRLRSFITAYPGCKSGYTTYTASASIGPTIANSNKPYTSNQDEYFLITNPGGTLILQLIEMSMERAFGCIYDRLIIYNSTVSTGAPTTTTTTLGPPLSAEVNLINEVLTNYSSANFPVRNLSSAVEATVDFFWVWGLAVRRVQQKLTTTIQFKITWTDDSMVWPITKLSGISKLLMPQVYTKLIQGAYFN
ncbi:deleted in malignant brain tumors 1 protein-like [Ruditapes philippinarum]|uniref:deleted in malignant brain tumors 1 protein-like n=1 Tax=Ruditapes philippinarum TaxID=129788 RepID=UPI00295B0871|nr:deleted in malignant brain tumors 1 protein-like [Ruditapes philippinarum]